jgi:hypothetical protein
LTRFADKSVTCAAKTSTVASCPEPVAKAFDHHDGDISDRIVKTVLLVNEDGVAPATAELAVHTTVSYDLRAEWVLKYEVSDRWDNHAHPVTFSMVFDDTAPPVLITNYGDHTVQSCDKDESNQDPDDPKMFLLPLNGVAATDNYDGSLTGEVEIKVTSPENTVHDITKAALSHYALASNILGEWSIDYSVEDHAGMFGTNGQNNPSTLAHKLTIVDTIGPNVYCKTMRYEKHTGKAAVGTLLETIPLAAGVVCEEKCDSYTFNRVVGSAGALSCNVFEETATDCKLMYTVATNAASMTAGSSTVGFPVGCNVADNNWECGVTYDDPGAYCVDMRDSYLTSTTVDLSALDGNLAVDGNTATGMVVDTTDITYSCSDTTGNAAAAQTRKVIVRDTTPPTLAITTAGAHEIIKNATWHHTNQRVVPDAETFLNNDALNSYIVEFSSGYLPDEAIVADLQEVGKGSYCVDACSADPSERSISTEWLQDDAALSPNEFPTMVPGTYVLKYTCTDQATHSQTKMRTIINQDKTQPALSITGASLLTVEASLTLNYNDDGALCSDGVDGMINDNVQVSGDEVDRAVVGSYSVNYDCSDSAGNAAFPLARTVVIVQTTCPTCTITGQDTVAVEASFPYTDAGIVCTDPISVDASVVTPTTTVNVEAPGSYEVTYRAINLNGLANDDAACSGGATTYTRTVTVTDTLTPVIALTYQGVHIHTGTSSGVGVNGETNPASAYDFSAGLMALPHKATANSQMWVLGGAAASAIGLALLASASRRTANVPVPV